MVMQQKEYIPRKDLFLNVPVSIPKMEIRFAENRDLPKNIDLCCQHAEYENAAYDKKNKKELLFNAIFGELPVLKCFVVDKESKIVGYVTYMRQFSTWDADFYIYIDCLFLTEETRGKGLGTALMDKIKEYAKK